MSSFRSVREKVLTILEMFHYFNVAHNHDYVRDNSNKNGIEESNPDTQRCLEREDKTFDIIHLI